MSFLSVFSSNRWKFVIFGVSFTLSLVFCFVVYTQILGNSLRLDPDGYGSAGRIIYEQGRFDTTTKAPLYPAFVALVSFLAGGYSVAAVQIAQCLMLAATCVLIYQIFLLTLTPAVARWAGLVCAIFPLLIWYTPRLWTEIFLTFMVALFTFVAAKFFQNPDRWTAFLLGVITALTALSKGIALIFFVMMPIAMLLKLRKSGVKWVLVFVCTSLIVYAPWVWRNWTLTDQFLLSQSNVGINLLLGNGFARNWEKAPLSYAELKTLTIQDHPESLGEFALKEDDPVSQDNLYFQVGIEELTNAPLLIFKKLLVQSCTFWYLAADASKSILTGTIQFPLVIFAVVGLVSAIRQRAGAALLFIPVFGVFGGSIAIFAFARLSVPIMPYVIGLAVHGFRRVVKVPH